MKSWSLQEIAAAYEVLKDKDKRTEYNYDVKAEERAAKKAKERRKSYAEGTNDFTEGFKAGRFKRYT